MNSVANEWAVQAKEWAQRSARAVWSKRMSEPCEKMSKWANLWAKGAAPYASISYIISTQSGLSRERPDPTRARRRIPTSVFLVKDNKSASPPRHNAISRLRSKCKQKSLKPKKRKKDVSTDSLAKETKYRRKTRRKIKEVESRKAHFSLSFCLHHKKTRSLCTKKKRQDASSRKDAGDDARDGSDEVGDDDAGGVAAGRRRRRRQLDSADPRQRAARATPPRNR